MPKIKFETTSALTPKDTFGKIKSFFTSDVDLRKLDPNYQCQFDDTKLAGTAKGSKFDAAVSVHPDNTGSRVQIEINIPLMLSPFKGFVEKTVQQKLGALISKA
jgi:hypothetical protein